jgi:hypothetical protein
MMVSERKDMYTLKAFRVGKNNEPRYLFHGNFGSTEVRLDKWIECDCRIVRDGTGDKWYESAFHSMPDQEAVNHWKKSLTDPDRYVVVRVRVKETRLKSHSKHKVILSRYLYLNSKDWERALEKREVANGSKNKTLLHGV